MKITSAIALFTRTVVVVSVSTSLWAATLTRGPYLQNGTPTSVVVRWRTDTATDTLVRYGDAPGNLTQSAYALSSRPSTRSRSAD